MEAAVGIKNETQLHKLDSISGTLYFIRKPAYYLEMWCFLLLWPTFNFQNQQALIYVIKGKIWQVYWRLISVNHDLWLRRPSILKLIRSSCDDWNSKYMSCTKKTNAMATAGEMSNYGLHLYYIQKKIWKSSLSEHYSRSETLKRTFWYVPSIFQKHTQMFS